MKGVHFENLYWFTYSFYCFWWYIFPNRNYKCALKLAGDKNPVVIALTDHDTVAGTEEFQKAAAKHKERLTAISGVEISTDYHGVEIHVLGYNIDTKNKALLERLAVCRESRDGRNAKIIEKLQEQGFKISMDEIKPDKPGETIARPTYRKASYEKEICFFCSRSIW